MNHFCDGKGETVPFLIACLLMRRNRIVDFRLYVMVSQVLTQVIPAWREHGEYVIDRVAVATRNVYERIFHLIIYITYLTTPLVVCVKVVQLRIEDSRLYLVHSGVPAYMVENVMAGRTIIAKAADKACQVSVIGCNGSCISEGTEVFGGIEAVSGCMAEGGGFSWNVECGNRLAACYRRDARMWNEECVNGPYGLRRVVEHLLPEFFPLHSGLTTGTCATAATVAAAIRLLTGETPSEVPVILPDGETIHVPVTYGSDYASVFKESGDDPDVTNGIEVRARVEYSDHFEIVGGEGVGRFTLPGFDFPPGSPAINKAPREMIARNLDAQCIASISPSSPLRVTISVPQGEEIARRTFNPRLGIEGGISIIGVSGIVKPFSEEAFISSIRKCMEVAKASGTARVVINSGAKSERFLKALYPDLPSQAFVEYGNYIGETLKIANELKIRNFTLGVMLGKAVKLAAGHLDTHSKRSTMDIGFISQMLSESGIDIDISDITLARELWEKIPAPQIQDFVSTVISHCENHCRPLLPNGQLTIMLVDDNGRIMT